MGLFKEVRKLIKERQEDGYYDLEWDQRLLDYFDEKGSFVERYDEDYGDRWNKYDNRIYKFIENEEVLLINARQTVGLTEVQSDGGFEFFEVIPKERIIIEYERVY